MDGGVELLPNVILLSLLPSERCDFRAQIQVRETGRESVCCDEDGRERGKGGKGDEQMMARRFVRGRQLFALNSQRSALGPLSAPEQGQNS